MASDLFDPYIDISLYKKPVTDDTNGEHHTEKQIYQENDSDIDNRISQSLISDDHTSNVRKRDYANEFENRFNDLYSSTYGTTYDDIYEPFYESLISKNNKIYMVIVMLGVLCLYMAVK